MARIPYIIVGSLNVVASPHPEGIYLRLMDAMKDRHVRSRGAEHAMIGTMSDGASRGQNNVRFGYMFFYTQIDTDGAWLDLSARSVATEEAVETINIPEHLRPNMRQMRYVFDAATHTFYFEVRNEKGHRFPPSKVKHILEKLAEAVRASNPSFPEINITVIPQSDAIERVLSVPFLSRLYIKVQRPNPDDIGDDARDILKQLEEQNAASEEISLIKSKDATALTPNAFMKSVARIAATNGLVRSHGADVDGTKIARQTTNYPKEDRITLEGIHDPFDAFYSWIWNN